MNLLRIAAGIGGIQGRHRIQHRLIMGAAGRLRLRARLAFTGKGRVNGLAKCIPQLLFQFSIEWNGLRLRLPGSDDVLRLDYARDVRSGRQAWSVVVAREVLR